MLRGVERLLSRQELPPRRSRSMDKSQIKIQINKKFIRYAIFSSLGIFFISLIVFSATAKAQPEASLENQLLASQEQPSEISIEETGAGPSIYSRKQDTPYKIKAGETLSEIAYSFDISLTLLIQYNNISNPKLVKIGQAIVIPSIENGQNFEHKIALGKQPIKVDTTRKSLPARVDIVKTKIERGYAVNFRITDPNPESLTNIEWDLGDGRKSYNAETHYEYQNPKTYKAKLVANDAKGQIYKSEFLIDVPHPDASIENSSTKFYTLSSIDDSLLINGKIEKVIGYKSLSSAPIELNETGGEGHVISFKKSGYFGLIVTEGEVSRTYSVFVSPIPSIHSDRTDLNWYRTQFNTSTPSNCGPTSVSIGIGFATGKYVPVADVRSQIGWTGNGSTSFEDLLKVLKTESVNAYTKRISSAQDLRDIIDKKGIAIILFDTTPLEQGASRELFGKYYSDNVGHYIVIKGYSLNGEFLIAYDPIPSDWGSNNFRYEDGLSMIGKNRYYPTKTILNSLRRAEAIVIPATSD